MTIQSFDFATGKVVDSRRHRIIISDIDSKDLFTIQNVVRSLGFQILGKEESLKALLELVKKHEMGVLLLDLDNPEVNFEKLGPEINRIYPEFKVVLMAQKADKDTIQNAIKFGACGFLIRPINMDSLMKILSSVS